MSAELKPCQHCNGPVHFHADDECSGCHSIFCPKCNVYTDFAGADPSNEVETIEELRALITPLWNTRAAPAQAMTDAARYEYLLECDFISAKNYLPDLDEAEWKSQLRAKHDKAISLLAQGGK